MANEPPRKPSIAPAVLEAERERTVALLSERFADDSLDVDEFDRRVAAAHDANSSETLAGLIADLAAAKPSNTAIATTTTTVTTTTTTTTTDHAMVVRDDPNRIAALSLSAIFGGVDRRGRWSVPKKMTLRCVMGGMQLDFREADFAPGVTELHVTCIMGGLEMVVPPDIQVDVACTSIMGGVDARHPGNTPIDPTRPTIRITGTLIMGGIDLQWRLPGETRRDSRRRARRERRALRRGENIAALPSGSSRQPGND